MIKNQALSTFYEREKLGILYRGGIVNMNNIYIVGIVASGKSTLARTLLNHSGIPHYELDTIVHNYNVSQQYKRTQDEQICNRGILQVWQLI